MQPLFNTRSIKTVRMLLKPPIHFLLWLCNACSNLLAAVSVYPVGLCVCGTLDVKYAWFYSGIKFASCTSFTNSTSNFSLGRLVINLLCYILLMRAFVKSACVSKPSNSRNSGDERAAILYCSNVMTSLPPLIRSNNSSMSRSSISHLKLWGRSYFVVWSMARTSLAKFSMFIPAGSRTEFTSGFVT